jgi:hypothetical protein
MNKNIKLMASVLIALLITLTGCVQKMVIPEDGILQTKSLYDIHRMKGRFVSYEEYQKILRAKGRIE